MDFEMQTLLLVEDNEDDVFIFRRAFGKIHGSNPVQVVNSGQAAVDYLSGRGCFADRRVYPLPFAVLLDLKLPGRQGLEILAWIRAQPALSRLVVGVLSSSAEPRDVAQAGELGAAFYFVKPPLPESLTDMLRMLREIFQGKEPLWRPFGDKLGVPSQPSASRSPGA